MAENNETTNLHHDNVNKDGVNKRGVNKDDVKKVVDIINDTKIGMFTTTNDDGVLVSRPLAAQEVGDDGDLWFFTDKDTSQVSHIRARREVNVSFGNRSEWVSVAGRAEVIEDPEKARQLWNSVVEAWFPKGPTTPGLVLIRVESESAQYWDTPGGTVATVLSWVKSRLTGQRIDAGESHTTKL
ncbi:pyridoxamine 5'-phosphate oxidase family protein [Arthrobacter sp. H14-L1]|uniref:pyridoxamine 5'-phosphate oxidase family protein n=1 Tax=Arthrobacter sp. H14-L1 TaxID=2996697 RepID=UPI002270E4D7|nr:pyridoxamine 5'-phosphate oxidase family protein [Arthrobacter sp. H14-L1]MCY0903693.1 pyridoxamine 5'-phosphate oxidase family protein [Arthrobacter sp. H14-L1]